MIARAKVLPMALALLGASASLLACNSSSAATFSEPMTLGGREVSAATLNRGHDLYFRHCVSCHGETGAGDGPAARHMKFAPRDFRSGEFSFVERSPSELPKLPSHEALVERIRSGVPERGMPPWKGMREQDLSALADFIKTFSPRWKDTDV